MALQKYNEINGIFEQYAIVDCNQDLLTSDIL